MTIEKAKQVEDLISEYEDLESWIDSLKKMQELHKRISYISIICDGGYSFSLNGDVSSNFHWKNFVDDVIDQYEVRLKTISNFLDKL